MTSNTWTQRAGMTSDTDTDNVESYAEQALASKNAAATSATSAATSASNSAASATSSQDQVSLATAQAVISTNQATASASSASSSAGSATTAGAAQTAAETAKAGSETAQTAAETAQTAAETAETAAETARDTSVASAATSTSKAAESAASAAAAATSQASANTSSNTATTKASEAATSATASEASKVASVAAQAASETAQTASEAAQSASETAKTGSETAETNSAASASTSTTQAGISTTKASDAASSATDSATSASASEAAKDAALAALDNFDDRYLGAKASDPTLDNDGNALVSGALYFNTTDDVMKVYTGSAWVAAYASLSGALLVANNLSDLASATSGRTNLGLVIGTNVQAFSAILAATTASYTTAEETKLAGIENAATADQTGAQIKAAYEAETNAFTDAQFTKLAGIETAADVTDATNVTAAGALMDSEVTNLAQVKAFSSADYATSAQGTLAANALPKAGGALTGAVTTSSTFDGRDVATDGAKLDGIASGATNVTNNNQLTNGAGYTTNVGDITGVTAGSGITGGGTSGTVTVSHADTSTQASLTALTGAAVVSDIDLDTYGHVTSLATRNLTLANLGYTGATNANYITNNNQLTNGAGYTTYTSNQATNTSNSVTFGQINCADVYSTAWLRTTGSNGVYFGTYTGGWNMTDSTWIRAYNNKSILTSGTMQAGTFNTTSDRNTKKDIKPIENALEKVQQLGGYSFTFKATDQKSSGVIAQEVQKVMPELVQEGGEGHLTVQYGNMVGLLIEAIKEQQAQIDALTAKLNG
tara:strand:+ start:894 stop:3230 length:2337 start_codon:yes stop_codon:yes gene_type:complete